MQSQCTSKPHTMLSAQHNMYIPDWMEPIHVAQCPLHPDSDGVWPSPPLHSRDNHVDHRKKEGVLHQWIDRCTRVFLTCHDQSVWTGYIIQGCIIHKNNSFTKILTVHYVSVDVPISRITLQWYLMYYGKQSGGMQGGCRCIQQIACEICTSPFTADTHGWCSSAWCEEW